MIDGAINAYNGFGNTIDAMLNSIVRQPIGLGNKNYTFLKDIMAYGIGSLNSTKVNYFGDSRGAMVNIHDDNKNPRAWFFHDGVRQYYSDYIAYVEDNYYYGRKWILDYATQEDKVRFFNHNDFILENNKVGVVRGYNFNEVVNNGILLNDIGYTNPNGYGSETRLGIINNFYLNNTLQLSDFETQKLMGEYGDKKITIGGYDLFGLHGLYGVKSSVGFVEGSNGLRKQSETTIVDDAIQVAMGEGIGYYSSIEGYSTLINQTNNQNKNYLIKSLLGFDLLDERYYTDINKLNDTAQALRQSKKYRPTNGKLALENLNYINTLTARVDQNRTVEEHITSYNFVNAGNNNLFSAQILWEYAESEGKDGKGKKLEKDYDTANLGISYGKYYAYSDDFLKEKEDLVYKTNKNFQNAKYKTLIARFHTDEIDGDVSGARGNNDITSTAISQYGMSKGRNLLKKNHKGSNENGYSNPYCRVWTYHHQYKSLEDTIRPFDENINENDSLNEYRSDLAKGGDNSFGYVRGSELLSDLSVKGKNGQVKFTPFRDNEGRLVNKPQQCMFSIENLAWKGLKPVDRYKLEEEQVGPLGGRIMWFPPYDLKFSENVSTNWGQTDFIGRGEHIYTYTNTERSGNLSFKLLVDHPSIINSWRGIVDGIGDVDDVESSEQTLLRFFAGCEMLDGKKKQIKKIKENENVKQTPIKAESLRDVNRKTISFVVYFPNNYSGVNDWESAINPIEYLLNGYSTNRYGMYIGNTKVYLDYTIDMQKEGIGYEINKNSGITKKDKYPNGNVKIEPYKNINNTTSKEWWYRVDNKLAIEKLKEGKNYEDTRSFQLNSIGYQQGLINEDETETDTTWCSFLDMYLALCGEFYDHKQTEESKKVKDILNKTNIKEIKITGYASTHGDVDKNKELAKNRAKTIKKWLEKYLKNGKNENYNIQTGDSERVTNGDASSLDAKKWRSAKVEIIYDNCELYNSILSHTNKLTLLDKKEKKSIYEGLSNEEVIEKILSNTPTQFNLEEYKNYLREKNDDRIVGLEQSWENAVLEKLNNNEEYYNSNERKLTTPRYQDEYLFFSELEKNEPFLHSKLVEKIKYFDPAFHSITPEGFQSRLTFLHQCTRQGGTHSNSDTYTNVTADNLSFGRPPVCVLRIGDFYYTKILIKSINIKYDDATWDLNDEGIGVMPMMANIDINFVFIGGSDLGGPITRLQNAVSFNYYANTAVYDNRAEMVKYENGEINDFRQIIMDSGNK